MRALIAIAAAALAAAVFTAGARATDFVAYEAPVAEQSAPVYQQDGFNWNGFYAGAIVGWYTEPGDTAFTFGKAVGVNFTAGNILYGVEFNLLQYNFGSFDTWNASGQTRLGLLVNDSTLVYKLVGVGYYNGGGSYGTYVKVGAGLEYALGQHFTVRGEYHAKIYPGGCCGHELRAGLLWHLN